MGKVKDQLKEISQVLKDLEIKATLSGTHDTKSAILSIQAGAGGIDSQDWAEMLRNQSVFFDLHSSCIHGQK